MEYELIARVIEEKDLLKAKTYFSGQNLPLEESLLLEEYEEIFSCKETIRFKAQNSSCALREAKKICHKKHRRIAKRIEASLDGSKTYLASRPFWSILEKKWIRKEISNLEYLSERAKNRQLCWPDQLNLIQPVTIQ